MNLVSLSIPNKQVIEKQTNKTNQTMFIAVPLRIRFSRLGSCQLFAPSQNIGAAWGVGGRDQEKRPIPSLNIKLGSSLYLALGLGRSAGCHIFLIHLSSWHIK